MDSAARYHRHRFPIEIVSQCVWPNFPYSPSYLDVEEIVFERGIAVSYETIRRWFVGSRGLFSVFAF